MTKQKDNDDQKLNQDADEGQHQDGDTGDKKQDGDKLTPEQQAIVDKRIAKEIARVNAENERAQKKWQEEQAQKAQESALEQAKEFEKLAEQRGARVAQLEADLAARQLEAETDKALDAAGIVTPSLRNLIKKLPGDMEIRKEEIRQLTESLDSQIENAVSKRLETHAPGRNKTAVPSGKKISQMTLSEKVALRNEIGDQAFAKRIQEEKQTK